MKALVIISILLNISGHLLAGVEDQVFIRGKVANDFNDKKVKVVDSFGQVFYLPTHVFPKNFKFQQGASFSFEVKSSDLKTVKIVKN